MWQFSNSTFDSRTCHLYSAWWWWWTVSIAVENFFFDRLPLEIAGLCYSSSKSTESHSKIYIRMLHNYSSLGFDKLFMNKNLEKNLCEQKRIINSNTANDTSYIYWFSKYASNFEFGTSNLRESCSVETDPTRSLSSRVILFACLEGSLAMPCNRAWRRSNSAPAI